MWVAKAHAEAADSEGVAATNYEDSDSDTESDNEETGLFTEQEETEASGAV